MATKVRKTETYKDSQGEHIVVKGKLLLIYIDKYFPEIGMIGSNNVHPLFLWTNKHNQYTKDLVEYQKTKCVLPIIISETENIEVGDRYFHPFTQNIHVCNTENIEFIKNSTSDKYLKILAIPEQFSPKHLQAIVDGKLNSGDEVYIKCEVDLNKIPTQFIEYIKLTNNHIKLFPVNKESEKLYSKNEILEKVNQWFREEASVNGLDSEPIDRWLSKNL